MDLSKKGPIKHLQIQNMKSQNYFQIFLSFNMSGSEKNERLLA